MICMVCLSCQWWKTIKITFLFTLIIIWQIFENWGLFIYNQMYHCMFGEMTRRLNINRFIVSTFKFKIKRIFSYFFNKNLFYNSYLKKKMLSLHFCLILYQFFAVENIIKHFWNSLNQLRYLLCSSLCMKKQQGCQIMANCI